MKFRFPQGHRNGGKIRGEKYADAVCQVMGISEKRGWQDMESVLAVSDLTVMPFRYGGFVYRNTKLPKGVDSTPLVGCTKHSDHLWAELRVRLWGAVGSKDATPSLIVKAYFCDEVLNYYEKPRPWETLIGVDDLTRRGAVCAWNGSFYEVVFP